MVNFIYGLVAGIALAGLAFAVFRNRPGGSSDADTETQKQLEELGKLTGGLAHEIKNPLSTVKVNLKLISEDIDPSDQKNARWQKKIEIVRSETDRLSLILDDFLKYIHRIEPNTQPVNLNDLLGELIDFYSPQARDKSITIRQGLADKPIICDIDADMIKQVLLNLFINAQQAMEGDGELIIRTSAEKGFVRIEVSDTGRGIAPEKLDNIFEAYYTSKAEGSGLGLSTARKIILAHKGTITVNSQPGKGTSFTITLPEADA
ncbi:hypothetical protein LCGC14_2567100 [marine sediment metagenome]|uniref:histidine kinase n=1 Tax=marine sediment metagenome TaxID=412755 RepID=A0A0F9AIU3_9ZZZZ|nr:two-component sensor histidine kinase [Phycisphaerales bacterium]